MSDGWSEKALQDLEAVARQQALYQRIDALAAENKRLRARVARQRRELKRLNRTLGPYWQGFRKGIDMEGACRLRGIMNATFGHKAVRAAEIAAIDAARSDADSASHSPK